MSILDGKIDKSEQFEESSLTGPAIGSKGEETMVRNMNISKSIADILNRAKIPRQTFETDAWYVSNGTAKTKEDESER